MSFVSDPMLRWAFEAAVITLGVAFLMLVAVVFLRLRLLARRRRERRFLAVWRPLMVQCVDSVPVSLPRVTRSDRALFLQLWNHYQESLRGAAGDRLNELAAVTGIDAVARAMLTSRSLRERLIAIVTLGHLGDTGSLEDLRRLARGASPLESLAAAHAMLRIDPGALGWVVAEASRREEWPIARVASILAETGVDRVTPALSAALDTEFEGAEAVAGARRLLRLVHVSYAEQLGREVRLTAARARDPALLADCLNALRDPNDADLPRTHAGHPSRMVRVAAAKALGRIGDASDRERLVTLLADPHWWVRYRAGKALMALPSVGRAELERIRDTLADRYAVEMLHHVLAEDA